MGKETRIILFWLGIILFTAFVSSQITKNVECSSSYDCRLTSQVCDLNTWTCVDADVNLQGQDYSGLETSSPEGSNKAVNNNSGLFMALLGIIIALLIIVLIILKKRK